MGGPLSKYGQYMDIWSTESAPRWCLYLGDGAADSPNQDLSPLTSCKDLIRITLSSFAGPSAVDSGGATLVRWHHMDHVQVNVCWLPQRPQDLRGDIRCAELAHPFVH